jgi:hypothetical protein
MNPTPAFKICATGAVFSQTQQQLHLGGRDCRCSQLTLKPHAARKAHWTGNGTNEMNAPMRILPIINKAMPTKVLQTMIAIKTVVWTRM